MTFIPENRLEEFLVKWKNQDCCHSHFLREFLAAEVFLIHYGPAYTPPPPERAVPGLELSLTFTVLDEVPCIPLFSSLARLQAFTREKSSHYSLKARDFLGLTLGANVCLNPGSEYPVLFLAGEIADLLADAY